MGTFHINFCKCFRNLKQYEAEIDYGKKMKLRKKVKQWKEALEEVADLAGMDLKNQADG